MCSMDEDFADQMERERDMAREEIAWLREKMERAERAEAALADVLQSHGDQRERAERAEAKVEAQHNEWHRLYKVQRETEQRAKRAEAELTTAIDPLPIAADAARWHSLANKLAEALRLTQEYVGEDTLPSLEGWAWFDALTKWEEACHVQHG